MAHLLCYVKLCAFFRSHWWIQTWVTVRKRRVSLKFDGWLSKTIGHHFYATSSFVHPFVAIGEFKDLAIWRMTWKTIGHLFYVTSSFVHHSVTIGEFKLELQSGNDQFGSKSTIFRAVWPCNLTHDLEKQGKSEGFESCDRPIVRKRPIWVKIGDVLYRVTLKFDGWPWKTIGHLSFAVSSFVQHFIAIGEFKTGVTVRKRPIWVKFDDF